MQSANVNAGDTIDFVVGNFDGFEFDTTVLDATISAVPAPSAAMLLGVGGLCFARRKR